MELDTLDYVIGTSKTSELTKYRLNEIDKIKNYFNAEINERKAIVKKISKYTVVFHIADKIFITLSASFGTLSVMSYATVVGIPVGIAGISLTLIFTVTTGIIKNLLNIARKKKKKQNKIISLAKNKLNNIEALLSQALTDFDVNHDEFSKILDERDDYELVKENVTLALKNSDEKIQYVNDSTV